MRFDSNSIAAPTHWTGSPWTVLLAVAVAFAVLGIGAFFILARLVMSQVSRTPIYQDALRIAQTSPEAQNALGDQIRPNPLPFGWTSNAYGSQFAEWSVTLVGERSHGVLYGVANDINGKWEFSRLTLIPAGSNNKINLAPSAQRLSLPHVPEKKVLLVPIDLNSEESLDWAPDYYKSKFGINVSVLPALHAEVSLMDRHRDQLNSEKSVEYLQRTIAGVAEDPSTILIAITSRDIYIPSYSWDYAENYRYNGRFAVISSARLRPFSYLARRNPEWLASRVQKMLSKNIAVLYFDLPLSSDFTSLLSGGVLTGDQVDAMSGSILGASGHWRPFLQASEPSVVIYDMPNKPALWRVHFSNESLPDPSAQVFNADLALGLFVQRQSDFRLGGKFPLQFVRVYRNQDDQSRSFGVGTNDSLDIFLTGQMGSYVDLILEDGGRVHFEHAIRPQFGDTYVANGGDYIMAVYRGGTWTISRKDGWKLYMPYRPQALPQNVTVLTGFSDPEGHVYQMNRDRFGDLSSITTPSGEWLHFEHDSQHRVHRIESSDGRVVNYEYDPDGCLIQVSDSNGRTSSYTYDKKHQMLQIMRGTDPAILTNTYDSQRNIQSQTMADGKRFEYSYVPVSLNSRDLVPDLITAPNGSLTYIRYRAGSYTQSLPTPPRAPH